MEPESTRRRSGAARYRIAALVYIALSLLGLYVAVRLIVLLAGDGYSIADAAMAIALAAAELFQCAHAAGYFASMLKAERLSAETPPPLFAAASATPVAVLVAAFNESETLLDKTLAAVMAMDYRPIRVFLLDDSTRDECRQGAERLAATYGVTLVHRTIRTGYKAGAINDLLPNLSERYIALLDADQRPTPSWLKDIVPMLDADPTLALVQAPQVYTNLEGLPVARAAACQQAIFYEYISEGKTRSNAMFCCGSNVVMRVDALESVARRVGARMHYFDETSVTEDFATTARLHVAGWRTAYVNRGYVFGMGPETLSAYFTQQLRWAIGTLSVGLRLACLLWRQPRALRPSQWWEYFLSGSYYFIGVRDLVFILAPVMFILFHVRPIHGHDVLYLAALIPYVVFTMNSVFYTMHLRGYPPASLWLATALSFATSWTYIKAALVAITGRRRAFGVTPKGIGGSIPMTTVTESEPIFAVAA